MAGRAVRSRRSSTSATRAPVQAPVPGSGIATRMIRPMVRYFFTIRPLRCARRSSQSIFGPTQLDLRSQSKIRRSKRMRKGIGTRLPRMAAAAAAAGGRPAAIPAGIAPRSSSTGTMAMRNVMRSSPKKVSNKSIDYTFCITNVTIAFYHRAPDAAMFIFICTKSKHVCGR